MFLQNPILLLQDRDLTRYSVQPILQTQNLFLYIRWHRWFSWFKFCSEFLIRNILFLMFCLSVFLRNDQFLFLMLLYIHQSWYQKNLSAYYWTNNRHIYWYRKEYEYRDLTARYYQKINTRAEWLVSKENRDKNKNFLKRKIIILIGCSVWWLRDIRNYWDTTNKLPIVSVFSKPLK